MFHLSGSRQQRIVFMAFGGVNKPCARRYDPAADRILPDDIPSRAAAFLKRF